MPVENTWELQPGGTLHINIPCSWTCTQENPSLNGPRFWARSGCRYNKEDGIAQCEIGTCGVSYDCSKDGLAGRAPVSLAEFCFQCGEGFTYYDVSLVDGYSLSVNIEPINQDGTPYTCSAPAGINPNYWCKTNLCNSGMDLRSTCPVTHQLKSSDIASYIQGGIENPDSITACFSNCGRYAYPVAPSADCDETTDELCRGWRKYCCQAPVQNPWNKTCLLDNDCPNNRPCISINGNPVSSVNPGTCGCYSDDQCPACGTCLPVNKESPSQNNPGVCTCSTFDKGSYNVCMNKQDNPPPKQCPGCGTDTLCIGDNTLCNVCSGSYNFPNSAAAYICSSRMYRVTFAPGGTANVPVTASGSIPKCSQLPEQHYDYRTAAQNCSLVKSKYACAVPRNGTWACDVPIPGGCNGVVCERDELPPPPASYPNCRDLNVSYGTEIYDINQGIQDCSIPNQQGSKYNFATPKTSRNLWSCGINPNTYRPIECGQMCIAD
jgi:hypothetical protein